MEKVQRGIPVLPASPWKTWVDRRRLLDQWRGDLQLRACSQIATHSLHPQKVALNRSLYQSLRDSTHSVEVADLLHRLLGQPLELDHAAELFPSARNHSHR